MIDPYSSASGVNLNRKITEIRSLKQAHSVLLVLRRHVPESAQQDAIHDLYKWFLENRVEMISQQEREND